MALKILLADDNITAQKMGSKILTDAGYQVVAVSNGAAAMKKIAAEKPELMILDVYMPGYSGLEVCQKVKSAPETAAVPVVLTVTNMEPFNPEDGNKVRADGVMIKPFEATDLLAVVQKFEAKLHPVAPPAPPAEPEYQKTQKMAALGFQDASYEEWKAEAPPEEEPAAASVAVPQEMAAAPVLGMEDMLVQAPEPAPALASGFDAAAFEPGHPAGSPAPFMELEAQVTAPPEAVMAPPPEVEFTSAPQVGEIETAPAAELEANGHAAPLTDVQIVQDPALVTNAEDMSQFVTKFGDAPSQPSYSIEELVAPAASEAVAAIPEITEAAPVAFEPPIEEPVLEPAPPLQTAPPIEPAPPLEEVLPVPTPAAGFAPEVESAAALEEEMRRAFDAGGGAAAAPALAPEPAPVAGPEPILEAMPFVDVPTTPVVEPPPPPPPAAAAIPDRLVEQFAAELAQVAPAAVAAEDVAAPEPLAAPPLAPPTPAIDEQRVSEAVQRVMSRYKDELVAAIVRELKF